MGNLSASPLITLSCLFFLLTPLPFLILGETPNKEEVNSVFWKAENYHQNYFFENEHVPYCQAVIVPKLIKAMELVKKINKRS